MNGTVRGMGSVGMDLGADSLAEKIRALSNGIDGIRAGTVTGCTARLNRSDGISAITVTGSTAHQNGGHGISARTVTGCTAISNGNTNILASGISGQNICGLPFVPCP
jgi:hypothetical protein